MKQKIVKTEHGSCICTFYNNGKANVMIIDSIWTEEKFRNQGWGTKLIEAAIELAKKENADSVELVTNKDNLAAKKLFQKTGFEKTNKDYYRLILNR